MVITWICHCLLNVILCYIRDLRHLKLYNQSSYFHNEKMSDMINYKKFPFR